MLIAICVVRIVSLIAVGWCSAVFAGNLLSLVVFDVNCCGFAVVVEVGCSIGAGDQITLCKLGLSLAALSGIPTTKNPLMLSAFATTRFQT